MDYQLETHTIAVRPWYERKLITLGGQQSYLGLYGQYQWLMRGRIEAKEGGM